MNKQLWKQQIHKRCGGGIIVVGLNYEIRYACSKCGMGFKSATTAVTSTDWRDVNKKDGLKLLFRKEWENTIKK